MSLLLIMSSYLHGFGGTVVVLVDAVVLEVVLVFVVALEVLLVVFVVVLAVVLVLEVVLVLYQERMLITKATDGYYNFVL